MIGNVLAALLMIVSLQSEGDIARLRDVQLPKQPNTEYTPKPMVGYIGLNIPPWISSEDIGLYARLLNLDANQEQALRELHASYVERCSAARRGREQSLWDRSAELAANRTEPPTVEHADLVLQLQAEADAFSDELWKIDEWFFGEAAVVLDLPSETVNRARMLRRRDVRMIQHIKYPGAGADLCRMALEMELSFEPDAVDKVALLAAQLEYEQTRTNLIEQLNRAIIASRGLDRETILLNEEARSLMEQDPNADRSHLAEAMAHVRGEKRKPVVELGKRLNELNERHLAALATLAPGKAVEQMREKYLRLAYKPIYPDKARLHDLLDSVLAMDELPETIRDAVASISENYRAEHAGHSERLAKFYLAWFEPFWTLMMTGPEFDAKGDEYNALWKQRIQLSEDTWARVRDVLPPAALSAIAEEEKTWRERVAKVRDDGPPNVSPYWTPEQKRRYEEKGIFPHVTND